MTGDAILEFCSVYGKGIGAVSPRSKKFLHTFWCAVGSASQCCQLQGSKMAGAAQARYGCVLCCWISIFSTVMSGFIAVASWESK